MTDIENAIYAGNPRKPSTQTEICPVCGRKLTVGVLHRVEKLADRAEGDRPDIAMPFENLIPLPEIIGSVLQVGPTSKRVQTVYEQMLATHGAELKILRELPIEKIAQTGDPLIAEGIRRMREGEVHIAPGYDGVYGKIQVFSDEDRARLSGQEMLFHIPAPNPQTSSSQLSVASSQSTPPPDPLRSSASSADTPSHFTLLDPHQQAAVTMEKGPVIVTAGPRHWKNPSTHPSRHRPDPKPRRITRFCHGRNIHQSRRN